MLMQAQAWGSGELAEKQGEDVVLGRDAHRGRQHRSLFIWLAVIWLIRLIGHVIFFFLFHIWYAAIFLRGLVQCCWRRSALSTHCVTAQGSSALSRVRCEGWFLYQRHLCFVFRFLSFFLSLWQLACFHFCYLSLKFSTCIILIVHQKKELLLRLSPAVSHTLVIAVIKIISGSTWVKTNPSCNPNGLLPAGFRPTTDTSAGKEFQPALFQI